MPLYEYECKQCRQRMEKIQSFSAPQEKICPKCGGELERIISAPAIQFKGAGWYINDYAKSGGKSAPSGDKESKADGKSESASESKAENISASSSETKSASESAPASATASAPANPPPSKSSSGSSKPTQ